MLLAWPLSELLVADADSGKPPIISAVAASAAPVTWRPARAATHKTGEALLKEAFSIAAIDALGDFSRTELAAIGLLLDYVKLTQAGSEIRLDPPRRPDPTGHLSIDPATRASLEIDRAMNARAKDHCLALSTGR